jgi:hypothetical protein
MKILANQASQFENKMNFRKLSRKSEIKVVGISASDAAKRIQKVIEKIKNDGCFAAAQVDLAAQ